MRDWLRQTIKAGGPRPVASYMADCLHHPRLGYYAHSKVIGPAGDFTTAPEISQIFGELIAVWCILVWRQLASPERLRIVELGPGRGTLMADLLRGLRIEPDLRDTLEVTLVEISEPLIAAQKQTLAGIGVAITWRRDLTPFDGPTIVIANEFLDALPVRQFVRRSGHWCERCVGLDRHANLCFVAGKPCDIDRGDTCLPTGVFEGDILESRWAALTDGRKALAPRLAEIAHKHPLVALFIDYGYEGPRTGDTFQAVRAHRSESTLAHPGRADLTAHVDFTEFSHAMRAAGLALDGPISQAAFLAGLGIETRWQKLSATAAPHQINTLETGVARLMAPAGMGTRFKAVVARSPGVALPAPF